MIKAARPALAFFKTAVKRETVRKLIIKGIDYAEKELIEEIDEWMEKVYSKKMAQELTPEEIAALLGIREEAANKAAAELTKRAQEWSRKEMKRETRRMMNSQ
jgi:DNA-binding GntR family transcriptional regulator